MCNRIMDIRKWKVMAVIQKKIFLYFVVKLHDYRHKAHNELIINLEYSGIHKGKR